MKGLIKVNDLVKINRADDGEVTVSGRELHEALEIKTAYKDWFPRMVEYGFVEGEDFCSFLSESTGGRPATDHAITLDMAKEICMIQRTPQGRACRQYFIEVEKKYKEEIKRISLLEPRQAKHCAYLEVHKDDFKKLNKDYGSLKDYCKSLEKRIRTLEKDHPISKYSKTLDSAERFIHEWIIIPIKYDGLRIERNALYNYYVEWCYNNGFLPYSKSKFTQVLEKEFTTKYVTLKDLTIKEYGKTYYNLAVIKKT